jgi:hypothetical protein
MHSTSQHSKLFTVQIYIDFRARNVILAFSRGSPFRVSMDTDRHWYMKTCCCNGDKSLIEATGTRMSFSFSQSTGVCPCIIGSCGILRYPMVYERWKVIHKREHTFFKHTHVTSCWTQEASAREKALYTRV